MAYGGYAGNASMSRTTANYAARGGASYNYNQTTSLASLLYLNPNQYFSFQNFLWNAVFHASNLRPAEDGTVSVTFDSSKYSTCLILAVDDKSSTQQVIDVS